MHIEFQQPLASPQKGYRKGDVADVPKARGERLISKGAAIARPDLDPADQQPDETTEGGKGGKGGKGKKQTETADQQPDETTEG